MRHTTDVVIARSHEAWAQKRPYYATFYESWRYAAPGVDPYRTSQNHPEMAPPGIADGSPRYDHLFDSTLVNSADKLANMLVHELFPAGRDWGELEEGAFFAPEEGDEQRRRSAIADTQTRLFRAIHASNFTLAVGSMTKDGVISGTGCMKVGASADADTLLDFEAINQAQVAFQRGPRQTIWGFYRKMFPTADEFPILWPGGRSFPTMTAEEKKSGKAKRYEVVEATYYDPDEGQWHYDVILSDDKDATQFTRVFQRDYVVSPWVAWRYWLAPGEVQGRSPVQAALPDARTVNKALEVRLKAASLRTAGIYTFKANDVFNPSTASFESGEFLPVGSNDSQNPTIRPLELAGDPQMGELVLEDTRASIRKTMLDMALPEPTGAVRSATEIIARQREAQQQLGQPFLRYIEEVGRPILRAVAYLMAEAGQLPELAAVQPAGPDGVPSPLMLDGMDVAVKFTSPMVMAQQLSDAETTIRWAEMARVAGGDAAFEAAVKTEEIPALLADKMGAPPELIRSEEERQAMAEENREAQLAQGMGGMAEMAPQPGAMAA